MANSAEIVWRAVSYFYPVDEQMEVARRAQNQSGPYSFAEGLDALLATPGPIHKTFDVWWIWFHVARGLGLFLADHVPGREQAKNIEIACGATRHLCVVSSGHIGPDEKVCEPHPHCAIGHVEAGVVLGEVTLGLHEQADSSVSFAAAWAQRGMNVFGRKAKQGGIG